jgi:hypothetical protein
MAGEHSEAAVGPCRNNLSLILRKLLGAGTPRELKNRAGQVVSDFAVFILLDGGRFLHPATQLTDSPAEAESFRCRKLRHCSRIFRSSATGC